VVQLLNPVPGAFPVLAVHDEIVVECDSDQAERVWGGDEGEANRRGTWAGR
jgi:hypothetical protein